MTRHHLGLYAAAPTTAGRVLHRLGVHVHLGHHIVMEFGCPRCGTPAGQPCPGVNLMHAARRRGYLRQQKRGAS